MERINNRMKSVGKTLESDTSLRISRRPGYDDRGYLEKSTLGRNVSKSTISERSSSQTKGTKFAPSWGLRSKNTVSSSSSRNCASGTQSLETVESDDEDELDFLSASSQPDSEADPSRDQRPVSSSRRIHSTAKKPAHFSPMNFKSNQGQNQNQLDTVSIDKYTGLPHDTKHLPKDEIYRKLSFKKIKLEGQKKDATSSSTSDGPVSKENMLPRNNGPSSWDPLPERKGKEKDKVEVLDLTSPIKRWDDCDARSLSPLSGKSANSNRPATPSSPGLPLPGRTRYDSDETPRPDFANAHSKMRPRPIPQIRTAPNVARDHDRDGRKDARYTTSKTKTVSLQRSQPVQMKSPKPKRKITAKPAPFPVIEGLTPGTKSSDRTTKLSGSPVLTPRAFPLSVPKDKGKGKEIMQVTEDEQCNEGKDSEERRRKRLKPKAFPMSMDLFSSTSTCSDSRSRGSAGKRSSEAGSEDERSSKKSRKGLENYFAPAKKRSIASPNRYTFDDEGDSMSFAPRGDPSTLCPFCDTPLPLDPSPLLTNLMETTKKQARRDPRPTNPLGLRAPLTTYIAVCQRHRFETKILPEAESKGWPKTIKWKKVGGRVLKMKDFLQALIDDPGNDLDSQPGASDWEVLAGVNAGRTKKKKEKGPKATSIFWAELMDEVKKKGLRAVSGFHGQFANFEKAQPGYYGEMGSVIIHQTLYNMFPPSEIDPTSVSPLTPTEFVQRILVPEVALHLIMEDRHLEGDEGIKEALEVLRESSTYGVAMFPEDGGEPELSQRSGEKMGAGDMIVMERARKRRKELEAEDAKEDEERRQQEELEERIKQQEAAEKLRQEKKLKKQRQKDSDSVKLSEPVERPQPKPRPLPSHRSKLHSGSGTDEDKDALWGNRFRSDINEHIERRIGSSVSNAFSDQNMDQDQNSRRSRSSSIASDQFESEIEEYRTRGPSSDERRRSPSASETRNLHHSAMSGQHPRAPSRGPSHLGHEYDSESSNGAVVEGYGRGTRSKSRARSRSKMAEDSGTDTRLDNGDSSDVQVVDIAKTPTARQTKHTAFDDEDTPKLFLRKKEMPPLEKARTRFANNKYPQKPDKSKWSSDEYKYMFSSQENGRD